MTVITTTLTSKGQATIPKAVRDLLGMKPGHKIEFKIYEDTKEVKVDKRRDIFDFLEDHGPIKPTRTDISVDKFREVMGKEYERV